ncbi:hypothetical protein ACS0TY_000994 [Phlomoides rotata]
MYLSLKIALITDGNTLRKTSIPNSRRVWTYMEEKELVCALKELVVKGHKCDNGFKSARGLQKKTFPFYADWCEIFGNDRATGADSQAYVDAEQDVLNRTSRNGGNSAGGDKSFEVPAANEQSTADFSTFNVGESNSATKDKSKGLKRKQVDELAVQFIDTMGGFCDRADSRLGNIASTMRTIAERVGSEFDAIKKRGKLFDMLELIKNLTVDDRVQISQFLCNNPKEMDLFFGLPDYAKTVLVKRIKKKLGEDE